MQVSNVDSFSKEANVRINLSITCSDFEIDYSFVACCWSDRLSKRKLDAKISRVSNRISEAGFIFDRYEHEKFYFHINERIDVSAADAKLARVNIFRDSQIESVEDIILSS